MLAYESSLHITDPDRYLRSDASTFRHQLASVHALGSYCPSTFEARPLSLDVIADETGFPNRQRMRRAFLRTMGQPPQELRRNYRTSNARAGLS